MKIIKVASQSIGIPFDRLVGIIQSQDWSGFKREAYKWLTTNIGWQERTQNDPQYEQKKQQWESVANPRTGGSPGWAQWDIQKSLPQNTGNFKLYFTPSDESAMKLLGSLSDLQQKLTPVSAQFQSNLSFKIPMSYTGYIGHNDRLVVHFSNQQAKDTINQIVSQWASDNGITMGSRTHSFGQDTPKDSQQKQSYGEVVINSMVDNLQKHKESGQYTDQQLAQWFTTYLGQQLSSLDNQ